MARMRIGIKEAGVELTAELNASATAVALWQILPVENTAQTWGAEVYLSVPVQSGPEDPQATVTPGAVLPPGTAKSRLQNLNHRFDSGRRLQENPCQTAMLSSGS